MSQFIRYPVPQPLVAPGAAGSRIIAVPAVGGGVVDATFAATTAGNADASTTGTGALTGGATFSATTASDATASTTGTGQFTVSVTFAIDESSPGATASTTGTGNLTGGATLDAATVGNADAAGGTGQLQGSQIVDATLTTLAGNADAPTTTGALTGDAALTLLAGNGDASGGAGALVSPDGRFSATTASDATASGGDGALTGTADATFAATTEGTANAAGGDGALTGTQNVTFTTDGGNADAEGNLGALVAELIASAAGGTATGTGWVHPEWAEGNPDDQWATWTSDVAAAVSSPLVVSNFGDFASIPNGSGIESVEVTVQHHEDTTGLDGVTAQVFLGATPLGSPTALTLSGTDHDDTFTVTLTLDDLRSNTLSVQIVGDRT